VGLPILFSPIHTRHQHRAVEMVREERSGAEHDGVRRVGRLDVHVCLCMQLRVV
jgi:hypothetical protein